MNLKRNLDFEIKSKESEVVQVFLRVISTGSKAGNCYALVSDSGQILLLDFGCDKKKILRGIDYRVSDVVSAVLTHGHG